MKRLSKNTNINKGQEVPSINLNLQTKAAQYLVQQGQTKEGGGGGTSSKNYSLYFRSRNLEVTKEQILFIF